MYSKAATTTFERRYGLPSTTSSTISICYNGAGIIGLIFTSIYGNRINRPKALGVGGLLVGVGAFIAVFPQFLSNPYKENGWENKADWSVICRPNQTVSQTCLESAEPASNWFFLLLVGEVIMGKVDTRFLI